MSMAEETSDKLRTLIVDDEPLAVERMQVICARMEDLAVVGTASDGAQALRLIEALKPDLVLLDMTMPEVGPGCQSARQRERPWLPPRMTITRSRHSIWTRWIMRFKPVKPDRLDAIKRAMARRRWRAKKANGRRALDPHRSELIASHQ